MLWKRSLSILLILAMAVSFAAPVLAADSEMPEGSGESYFDFESSEYRVDEDAGTLEIQIYRHGGLAGDVDVAVKTADFLSTYGQDYEILVDETPFAFVEGETTDPSDFVFEGDETEEAEAAPEEAVPAQAEDAETPEAVALSTRSGKASTGSPLRDAQRTYLDMPEDPANVAADNTDELLDNMYDFYEKAQGAQGILHFASGERVKTLTVRILDNDTQDGERMFLMALMGTDQDFATIAPNASTFVSIQDNDGYEAATFSLSADRDYLTPESPTATVTVTRTGGTQYFTKVQVSTVNVSADREDYEALSEMDIAFVPGQTEATFEVRGTGFTRGGEFGVRLTTEDTVDEIDEHYIGFTLSADDAALMDSGDVVAETTAAGSILGAASIAYGNWQRYAFSSFAGGWKADKTGSDKSNKASAGSQLYVAQYDSDKYSMLVTNNKVDLVGVYNTRFSMKVEGDGSKFNTWLDYDTDQTFRGTIRDYKQTGKRGWKEDDLKVNDLWDSYYLKFSNQPWTWGKHNPKSTLDWVRLEYSQYKFDLATSEEPFDRKLYDFTSTPVKVASIYYGDPNSGWADSTLYVPGAVSVKTTSGADVAGFYANAGAQVIIAGDSQAIGNGLKLKGVYFTKKGRIFNNGAYDKSNVYYLAASNNQVKVSLDRNFLLNLKKSGVIKSTADASETIRIVPVYEREMVEIHFENADRNDSDASQKGKFDASHLASSIDNVLTATGQKELGLTKALHAGWLDYYKMKVPKGSVIRVHATPSGDRAAAGILVWYFSGRSGSYVTSYQGGGWKFSDGRSPTTDVALSDYASADIVADWNICMKPNTGEQSFSVDYSPISYANRDDPYSPIHDLDLTGAVMDISSLTLTDETTLSDLQPGVNETDSKGSMKIPGAFLGKDYSLMANPPAGFYVSWKNMSEDLNKDGNITEEEQQAAGTRRNIDRSQMPNTVIGSYLALTQDLDNTQYYYMYIPTAPASRSVAGRVVRENNTFFNIIARKNASGVIPVSAAYVNVGGVTTTTDAQGNYTVPLSVTDWGNVSFSVTIGEVAYHSVVALERFTTLKLPALERFTAQGISASYASAKNADMAKKDSAAVGIVDDKLTLSATVATDGAIVPKKAHFYIYSGSGLLRFKCDDKAEEGYTTTATQSGNRLTASLVFNPSMDLNPGDKVFVQFEDNTGRSYTPIDLGYRFTKPMTLKEFLLPMLGSSLAETISNPAVVDIIGDPLGGIQMSAIDSLHPHPYEYTPPNVLEENADDYTWTRTDYSFGWSKTFEPSKDGNKDDDNKDDDGKDDDGKDDDGKDDDGKDDETAPLQPGSVGDAAKMLLDPNLEDENVGESLDGDSGFSTEGDFNFSITPHLGFKLTISTRFAEDDNGEIVQKYFFEDVYFYLKVDFDVGTEQTISTPVGINVIVGFDLSGSVAGVYRLYVDYMDSKETADAVPYDETFELFKNYTDSRRREGYIFLNPKLTVTLGVNVAIISVKGNASFDFDMDFHITGSGTESFGQIRFDIGWSVELLGFTVYEMSTKDLPEGLGTVTMFGDKPINFDYNVENAVTSIMNRDVATAAIQNRTTDRAYLENRTTWAGGRRANRTVTAMAGSTESELLSGTSDNMQVNMMPIGADEYLMVYVDDVPERSAENRRAVYYSLGSPDKGWSKPAILDDDGTLDDYPNVQALGDGRLLVTWSSADKVLPEGAKVEDGLKALNIEAAFFDTAAKTFSAPEYLTKTTEEDYAADVMPRAAYDPETDRVILYYTKTEFEDLELVSDIGKAFSVIAYRFYENGSWDSAYTPEELEGMSAAEIADYEKNWYGQRFLDVRLDSSSDAMPRVVDSDAICFNGLSLFAYTVDWDDDQSTSDDRDVFLQIYNFSENSFSHIIRISDHSGTYTLPTFATSDNNTYLFFGEKDSVKESAQIMYMNISYVIGNRMFEKVTQGANEYYVLQTTTPEIVLDASDGGEGMTIPEETVTITADPAAECQTLTDFDVFVADSGKMYLLWTDTDGPDSGREIYASIFNAPDEAEDAEDGDDSQAEWSAPVPITDAGKGWYYAGLSAVNVGDSILVVTGKSNYDDPAANRLVQLRHTPQVQLQLQPTLEVSDPYAKAGDQVEITATVRNLGLDTCLDAIDVSFKVNGEEAGTVTREKPLPGGTDALLYTTVAIPEGDAEITATFGDETATLTLEKKAILVTTDEYLASAETDTDSAQNIYTAAVENQGNLTSGQITFTAKAAGRTVGTLTLGALEPGAQTAVNVPLELADSDYSLDTETGMASATVNVSGVADGQEIAAFSETVTRQYDLDAITLIPGAAVEENPAFTVAAGTLEPVQPAITGVEEGSLTVNWTETSDPEVATIDYSGAVEAHLPGTATLTGMLVPNRFNVDIDGEGRSEAVDWETLIPEDYRVYVTATVTVSENDETVKETVTDTQTTEAEDGTVTKIDTEKEVETRVATGEVVSETVLKVTETVTKPDETVGVTVKDAEGNITEASVTVSQAAAEAAAGAAVPAPVAVITPATDPAEAPVITVDVPDAGAALDLPVAPMGPGVVAAILNEDGSCTVIPGSYPTDTGLGVPVSADAKLVVLDKTKAFTDVKSGGWSEESITYVTARGIFSGTGETTFSPEKPMTRAMTAKIIYNLDPGAAPGAPAVFDDIPEGKWYTEAVNWCNENGIVYGYGKSFGPDDPVTREQLVAILYRYAKFRGVDVTPAGENLLDAYQDQAEVHSWATAAMEWAIGAHLIYGMTEDTLSPRSNATREQVAAIMKRFNNLLH